MKVHQFYLTFHFHCKCVNNLSVALMMAHAGHNDRLKSFTSNKQVNGKTSRWAMPD